MPPPKLHHEEGAPAGPHGPPVVGGRTIVMARSSAGKVVVCLSITAILAVAAVMPAAARTPARMADAVVQPAAAGTWSSVGPNGASPAINETVYALAAASHNIAVGGDFYNAGGVATADDIARWNGTLWKGIGSHSGNGPITTGVRAIVVDGKDLYVAGTFQDAFGDPDADRIAMWDASSKTWKALGSGLNAPVLALAMHNGDLYAGGQFTGAGGVAGADYVARWDGHNWSKVGTLSDKVDALTFKNGTLFAGGLFTNADGNQQADYVAKWTGASWTNLGNIGANGALNGEVYSLLADGSDLIVGGHFTDAGGNPTADYIARWSSGTWQSLGSLHGDGAINGDVTALANNGNDIYAGGRFTDAGNIPEADHVALWDGHAWSALGSNGGNGAINDTVYALAIFDDNLFVGGDFHAAAGIATADHLAAWGLPVIRQPDGKVRKGTSGSYKGNNIYNTSAAQQKVKIKARAGRTITYQVEVQNDAPTASDSFMVAATGPTTVDFTITYMKGSHDITTAINAGTYVSPLMPPGAYIVITVTIHIEASARHHEAVHRLLTITSVGDNTKQDAVLVAAKRG